MYLYICLQAHLYIYIYIFVYAGTHIYIYVYHISSGINIEHGPHSKMWTVKYVYTASQKQNLGEWSGSFLFYSENCNRAQLPGVGFSLPGVAVPGLN